MNEPILPFSFDGWDLLFVACALWILGWAVTGVRKSIAAERDEEWLRELEEIERQRTADYERERRRRAEEQAEQIARFAERGK